MHTAINIPTPTREEVRNFIIPYTEELLAKARANGNDELISFHWAALNRLKAEQQNFLTNKKYN
jgi:hypothetical protein